MASNCLVTKLKGIVDNDNLPKLGEWEFSAPVDNAVFQINGISSDDVYTTGPGTLEKGSMGGHGWNFTTRNTVFGETIIHVKNVYNMTQIVSWGGIGLLKGFPKYTKLNYIDLDWPNDGANLGLNTLDTSVFKGLNLSYLRLRDTANSRIRINMDDLTSSTNLQEISIYGILFVDGSMESVKKMTSFFAWYSSTWGDPNGISGSFNDFGLCPSLGFVGYVYNYSPNMLGGSLEGLVANARSIDRTDGSMVFRYLAARQNVTWKGQLVPNAADANLSWTATTITYNGETIQNSDVAE